jgi:hypothetical protein
VEPARPLRRRAVFIGAALLAVVALATIVWQGNLFDVRAQSVATAFDRPPAYPGYTWTRAGRAVSPEEMDTIAGPSHCGWQSATMMFIVWPPGSRTDNLIPGRLYIRDPEGVYGVPFRDRLARNVTLPADARATGYRLGAIEVYVSPSDQDEAIYVVSPRDAERWPRVDPVRLCA